jgi:tetratricopeptide (TPR) repeat protein
MAADWIARGLQSSGFAEVVPTETMLLSTARDSTRRARTSTDAIRTLARTTAADYVVTGSIYPVADSVHFQARIIDAVSMQLVGSPTPVVIGAGQSATSAIDLLRQHVIGTLASALDPRMTKLVSVANNPPSLEAYSEFVNGMDAFLRRNDPARAVGHFQRAVTSDSSFVLPLLWMLEVYRTGGSFLQARADSLIEILERSRSSLPLADRLLLDRQSASYRHDLEAAYRASSALAALAPRSHFEEMLARDAAAIGRLHEATDVLTKHLDADWPWVASSQSYWADLAYILHDAGSYKEELATVRRARRHFPQSMRLAWLEAQALIGLGRFDEVRRALDECVALPLGAGSSPGLAWSPGSLWRNAALELRAHGQRELARTTLKRAEAWYASRPAEERALPIARYNHMQRLAELEEWDAVRPLADSLIAENSPRRIQALATIGMSEAARGRLSQAGVTVDSLLAIRDGESLPERLYLAAGVEARSGHRARALDLLAESFARGRPKTFWDHMEPSFESLRDEPRYREIFRPATSRGGR